MVPKWERRAPGRYRYEIRALEAVTGNTLRIDEDALAMGALIVEFDWPLDGKSIPLRTIYPDSFPRIRPNVRLRGDSSTFPRRHCSPLDGNLCLLGRDTRQWRQQWTLCKLLEKQLADALNDTGDEDPQGEPAEYWWNSCAQRGSYCLVDSSWTLGGAQSGTLKVRYRFQKKDDAPAIQAVVTEVRDGKGALMHEWTGAVPAELAASSREISIPWIYVDETILPNGKAEQIDELMGRFGRVPPWAEFSPSMTGRWFAVLYKMETGFRQEGLGWLFPFYFGPKKSFRAAKAGQQVRPPRIMFIPTYRAGEGDLGARVPAVGLLRTRKVAVVGLGAVGAPLAVELARNGCRLLHLVDHDRVEPGNAIRWPLGASAWGHDKSDSLAAFIRREYPWAAVREHDHAIGSFNHDDPSKGDDSLFEAILPEVDLVVDATASYGVSTILGDHCRARGIPLVALYASPPVEGGVVARFAPQSGCPTCLEFAHDAGTIDRAPGFGEDRGLQQPPGCAERTFTGASFDLQELSLQAMRLIVETPENPDGAAESVVHTLSLVADGKRIPPAWRVDVLPKAEGCSCSTAA